MPTSEELREMVRQEIREAIAESDKATNKRLWRIENAITSGLDGNPGLLERVRDLERSESVRNRTLYAAVVAVATAIAHTLWQLVTNGKVQP